MRLASLATSVPEHSWTQPECWEALRGSSALAHLKPRSHELLEKVLLGNSGIETRHLATERIDRLFDRSAQRLSEDFEAAAPALAFQAASEAMAKADVATVDALFVCTCTGYLCPGLSSHLAEKLGLPANTYLLDNTGAGCAAAVPTLRAAANYLSAHPAHRVAVVAVEICSAAFYANDDPGVLISLCLFGDGAAAVILDAADIAGPRFSSFSSLHLPSEREKIRFVNRDGKLCNQLHRSVPGVSSAAVAELYESVPDQPRIVSHGGGRDVLNAIRDRLPNQPLAEANEVLRTRGNMSSPSVLHALELALQAGPSPIWLASFGAGFTCHGCLLSPVC